jgi:hypothetical protein
MSCPLICGFQLGAVHTQLPNKKSRITFPGNPAIFFKIRSFPSPTHDGFGIFLYIIVDHGSVKKSRGILGRVDWVNCYPLSFYIDITPLRNRREHSFLCNNDRTIYACLMPIFSNYSAVGVAAAAVVVAVGVGYGVYFGGEMGWKFDS